MEFIDFGAQPAFIRPRLETALSRLLEHGQYIIGPKFAEIESWPADFDGMKYAITDEGMDTAPGRMRPSAPTVNSKKLHNPHDGGN